MATTSYNAFGELAPPVSSASTRKVPCHVFINHRGEDVKHTFATAIYDALTSMGLNVCLDVHWLKAGDEIPSELEAAMRSASVHIAIFSQKYAESPWCLAELSFMVKTGTPIIPIFYGVKPSDLRHVAEGVGIYVDAFVKHVLDRRYNIEKIVEWNRALHKISFINGYEVNNNSAEGDLLKKIVNDVRSMAWILSRVPYHNTQAVGIEHKITEVIKLLEWDNDKPTVAVVIHGIGGAGKTTLADEVYATLNLQGWKHSKVTFIKNLESNPNIEDLQSQILQDMTGIEPNVRDWQNGQQQLKSVIDKEHVFIYIDNILWINYLENLLPKQITSQNKVRILATSRKTNAKGVFESCGIKHCNLYSIESLSLEAALTLLCRKIDAERDANSIVEDRPQAKEIAHKFSTCPLFLEVVGAYLHKRNNSVEAYGRVFGWLRDGESFSCDKEDSFDEHRILFSYHELEFSAKEAFLDICSFFNGWKWEEVALIVGVEELQCLQDGALVKKIEVERVYDDGLETKIEVHDLLLTAGRNMPKNYRFRSVEDFRRAFENKKIVRQTKGVCLEYNYHSSTYTCGCNQTITPFQISADVIDAMSGSLRVFAMGNYTIVNGQCKKQFDKLRFFEGYQQINLGIDLSKLKHLTYMDYTFIMDEIWSPPKNISSLQVLKLAKTGWSFPRRNMGLPIEFGHLNNLKHMTLKCFYINEISSFEKLNSLEKLELSCIEGLEKSPGLRWKFRSLQELYMTHCDYLKKLPAGIEESSALTKLNLSGCHRLEELPCDFVKLSALQSLNLAYCKIEELPCDFEKLSALQSLNLAHCSSLVVLPEGLGNMPSLTYIDVQGCSQLSRLPNRVVERSLLKGRISLMYCQSLKVFRIDFSEPTCLQELKLRDCECLQELCNNFHYLVGLRKIDMSGCKSLSRLPQGFGKLGCLKRLELSECNKLEELSSDFGCLGALQYLIMSRCKSLLKLPDSFGELRCLQRLDLSGCDTLKELCSNFGFLGALTDLTLSGCKSLSRLPQGFGKLGCLKRLELSKCNKLEELSSDFGCLGALEYLIMSRCKSLLKFPDSFGELRCLQRLDLSGCDTLEELCSNFGFLGALNHLTLSRCKSLSRLPQGFGKLGCLKRLELSNCNKLEELSRDFGCLGALEHLVMSSCKSLSKLPDSFGELGCLQRLDLSGCDILEELCSNFGFLGALKHLTLSRCKSLSKLSDCFGRLGCLERLDLSMCSKLQELSSDFHCLPSLTRLDLSRNDNLGEKWMDIVGAIQSLWCLDITGSEGMFHRWIELQRQEKGWHFVAVTDSCWERTAEGQSDFLLRGMISKLFDEDGLLIDIHQRPFYSSSVLPDTLLILIIHRVDTIDGKLLEKYMQTLSSKALSIIYVGSYFHSLTPELTDRILAYTPPDRILSFSDRFHKTFPRASISINAVFRSSEDLEKKGIKCPSIWEDISYVLNEVAFLLRTPRESNVEILRAVLQTDYLLLNNSQQVNLTELQGKLILLLYSSWRHMLEVAFRDVFVQIRETHHHRVEMVSMREWDEFQRAPWPVVPNTSLIQKVSSDFRPSDGCLSSGRVVVVDGKGKISNKNALPMIERWGVEAYPFSSTREEELIMSEWEKPFNDNQFIFQSLEFSQTKGKEASPCGEMMLLCVGDLAKMLEFTAELDYALAKLKRHFQVFYVGWKDYEVFVTGGDEMKIKKIGCTIPSGVERFWQRIRYLYGDLERMGERMGSEKKIVQVKRKMVLSVVSADVGSRTAKEIRVIVVDKNGEMVSGKGKEMVEVLWQNGSDDSKVKVEGVRQVLQGQWKDGIINPKHNAEHLLLLVGWEYVNRNIHARCGLCSESLDYYFYRCSVCQNYVSFGGCIES